MYFERDPTKAIAIEQNRFIQKKPPAPYSSSCETRFFFSS